MDRLGDLANRSYKNSQFTFTNFLSLSELSDFYMMEKELSFAKPVLFGGAEVAERKMIRFGDPEMLGYEESFPIVCLLVKPLMDKFSDALSHRDYLGALMNLGIEREMLGDIYIDGHNAIIFCVEKMADYIIEELTRVKHTSVIASRLEGEYVLPETSKEKLTVQVASERVDAVVARVFKLSRDDSIELFREKKVFINSRLVTGNDTRLKEGDRVSVRGFGKFDVFGQGSISKKGKLNINVLLYK